MAQQLREKNWVYVHASEFQYSDPTSWKLIQDDGSAELINSFKLEVKGKCHSSKLQKDKTYVANLMVLLRKDCVFTTPTELQLTLPSEKPQEKSIDLKAYPKEKTIRLQLGKKFKSSSVKDGEIEFSLWSKYDAGKKGLVVYGVLFEPISDDNEDYD